MANIRHTIGHSSSPHVTAALCDSLVSSTEKRRDLLHESSRTGWTPSSDHPVSLDEGQTWPEKYHSCSTKDADAAIRVSPVDDQHVGIVYEGSQADPMYEWISPTSCFHE
ncbi:MAG: hypothetical protein R3C02_05420 [Planctomycetaceae bacterium]